MFFKEEAEPLENRPVEVTSTLSTEGFLIDELQKLPFEIEKWQRYFDEADRTYQAQATIEILHAITNPIFKDKEGKDRPASNDKEREIAANMALLGSDILETLWRNRENFSLYLQEAKNRFEAAKLLVQLLTRSTK